MINLLRFSLFHLLLIFCLSWVLLNAYAENISDNEAQLDLAHLYIRMGNLEKAKEILLQFIQSRPSDAHLLREYADLEVKLGHALSELDGKYWSEKGRGELSLMKRHEQTLLLTTPLAFRHKLSFGIHNWTENPLDQGSEFKAGGFSLQAESRPVPSLNLLAGWTHKSYKQGQARELGETRMFFNVADRTILGLGYDRRGELGNRQAIEQAIIANRTWISADSDLTRHLHLSGKAGSISYSDDNSGSELSVAVGYAFSDHPRRFRIITSGELRDTNKESRSIYSGAVLSGQIHPYWTPRDHVGTTITAEWNHDLSPRFSRGVDQHSYTIKAGIGTDSDANAGFTLQASWSRDFLKIWKAGVGAELRRSKEWDAEGLSARISRYF